MRIPIPRPGPQIAQPQIQQSQGTEMTTLLKDKANATMTLNKTQRAAFDKEMLAAMRDSKLAPRSDSERLMVAGVVPGALGAMQPSGSEVQRFSEKLNTVGDDAQLANVDLQNALQKQQQTMQMMSNISKQLHDTAMAVIRKIGG